MADRENRRKPTHAGAGRPAAHMATGKKNNRSNKKSFPRLRAFCAAAALTFCVLLLGLGFLIADYNTRQVGFGDGSLRVDVTAGDGRIMVNMLGKEKAIQVSDTVQKWVGRVWNLLPPDIRTTFWIFESECEAAPDALDWAGA